MAHVAESAKVHIDISKCLFKILLYEEMKLLGKLLNCDVFLNQNKQVEMIS